MSDSDREVARAALELIRAQDANRELSRVGRVTQGDGHRMMAAVVKYDEARRIRKFKKK